MAYIRVAGFNSPSYQGMELCTNKPYLPILALSLVLSSAFGDISIEGIPSEDYALLSYDPEASCEQHAPVLCGKDVSLPLDFLSCAVQ